MIEDPYVDMHFRSPTPSTGVRSSPPLPLKYIATKPFRVLVAFLFA